MRKVGLRVFHRFLIPFNPAAAMNIHQQRARALTLGLPEIQDGALMRIIGNIDMRGNQPFGCTRLLSKATMTAKAENEGGDDELCFHLV